MNVLKVGLFQYDILWEDIKGNQNIIEDSLNSRHPLPDLLVLPEMYATGFTMSPTNLPDKDVVSQRYWQQKLTETYGLAVMGSSIAVGNAKYSNRLFFTAPGGKIYFYDKRHLFQKEKESGNFDYGSEQVIIESSGVKIMPQICYDLRFPVWSRNVAGYHVLVYVANWPANRQVVWDTLLRARAIENQCYCIGVNRIGKDGNKIDYVGGSAVYGPKGDCLLYLGQDESYGEAILDIKELIRFRNKFGAYKDADAFEIKNPEDEPPGFKY